MPTYCWILLLLLIVAIFCCICTCSFKNFKDKLYGFIDVKNTNDKTILEKELDFINNSINGFSALALTVIGSLITIFIHFQSIIENFIGLKDIAYVIFLLCLILLVYLVLHIIEMCIKSSYKNKIIKKLQKMEKDDEKTTINT
jgi:uncharacterized membrane protein